MTNLECKCGCKLFNDFRPFTIDSDTFMVWNFKESIKPLKLTVPIVQCVSCGRIHPPKASFGGKNMLDEEVQLYAELLKYVANRNSIVDKATTVQVYTMTSTGKETDGPIKASPVSQESTEDVVSPIPTETGTRKNNKK